MSRTSEKRINDDPIQAYFGFHCMPFTRNSPIDALMAIRGQDEMMARLRQAIRLNDIALVTAPGGCGKSTALRRFVNSLDNNKFLVLYVPNPAPGLTGVYRDILKSLGHEPTYFRPQLVSQVRIALGEAARKGKQVVILFDEAHRLTNCWLEDLRMLLSADMDASALATLVLVGHPELRDRLKMTSMDALRSRINVRFSLKPLTLQESAAYIIHHVKVAGYRGDALYSDGFIARAHEYTNGIPRVLNQVCTVSLVAAMATEARIIDESLFQRAQIDLEEGL
jgi:type II secretory pathway predicted ATPase ExeA